MTKHQTRQSGFSLLELLLVVAISAILMLGIVKVTDIWIGAMKAEQAGQHIEMVRRAAVDFIHSREPDELNTLLGDITNNVDFQNFLPNGADSLDSPLGIGRTTNVRLVQNGDLYEIYINTIGAPIPNKLLVASANAVGAYGGLVSHIYGGTTAKSLFGTWDKPVGSFLVDPADVDDNGGQLAAYYAINKEEIYGPYLYRMEVDGGNTMYNTMDTNLLMNSNSILGASDVETQVLNVNLDATVNGTLAGHNATFDGSLTMNGASLDIAGNANINRTVTVESNMDVAGQTTVDRLSAFSATTGAINAGKADINDLTVNTDTVVQADAFAINSTLSTVTVDGSLEARNISADSASVSDTLYTGNLNVVGGGANIGGDVTLSGGTVVSDDMVVNNCLMLHGDPYGSCP